MSVSTVVDLPLKGGARAAVGRRSFVLRTPTLSVGYAPKRSVSEAKAVGWGSRQERPHPDPPRAEVGYIRLRPSKKCRARVNPSSGRGREGTELAAPPYDSNLGKSLLVVYVALLATGVAGVLILAGVIDGALAQSSPFGAPRPQAPAPPTGGILGWIFAKQAEFYRQFSGLIRAAKADGSAAWSLLGLSFLYGIFHAAGPGHGKAVISSYLVANEETWRRGVVLSFASALLQALVAVVVVGIAAALLNATAVTMSRAVNVIEILSYALIVLIGVRLLWVKGRAFITAAQTLHRPAALSAAATPVQHQDCGHHGDDGRDHHDHHHHHDHALDDDASAWGHAHAPEPDELAGPGGWKRGLSAIVAVGLRPCSGAILVLVFALAQGLFWAGVASTVIMGLGTAVTVAIIATLAVGAKAWAKRLADSRSGYGMLAMRGIEAGAAVVIIAFGTLLLTGYVVTERLLGI
jgi:nickel/cobalt transporter (NicO) family protein